MPSIKTLTPILGGSYYHIFNRGANRQPIFFKPENYKYFLKLTSDFLSGYVHFLAYCLLPNHFHFIIKVRDELDLENLGNWSLHKDQFLTSPSKKADSSGRFLKAENEIGKLVVRQLRKLFVTYAMAINKQENRIGNLFDPKYKRLEITNQDYLEYAIFYAHYNPERHGLTNDYKSYRYSSYRAIASTGETNIDREFVFELYGGKNGFLNYHSVIHEEREAVILD